MFSPGRLVRVQHKANFSHPLLGRNGGADKSLGQMSVDAVDEAVEVYMQGTIRVELIGHFKPCMTEIYLHI